MAFHTTSSGSIQPCGASVRACPLAPVEDHYKTTRDASRALALEAIDNQADYQLVLPEGWGQLIPEAVS